ncbi:hypothetical protein WJX72_004198 [[Myrmecia] bisecta]|uniref:Uncharacterized protein n=1 Tax=[Myrmecia] bisecta TaxID=41462 RepID=A0AAW1PWQ3_9CHLO
MRCSASKPRDCEAHQQDLQGMQHYVPTLQLVGRDVEVQAALLELQSTGCVLFIGAPGQGKSALAWKVGSVLWDAKTLPGGAFVVDLAAAEEAAPSATFANAAELGSTRVAQTVALQLIAQLQASRDAPALNAEQGWATVEHWLRMLNHHGQTALIILENAECMQANEECKLLLQTLQELPSIKLLITSRAADNFGLATLAYVSALSGTAALQLLQSACPADWNARAAAEVARLCGGNAQLLSVITGFLSAGRCTLQGAAHHAAHSEQPGEAPELLTTLDALKELARALEATQQCERALDVYRDIAHILDILGTPLEDVETLNCMEKAANRLLSSHDHGDFYVEPFPASRWDKAEALFSKVFYSRKQCLGPDHADTIRVMCSFVELRLVPYVGDDGDDDPQDRSNQAEWLCQDAIKCIRDKHGELHPALLEPYAALIDVHNHQAQLWDYNPSASDSFREDAVRVEGVLELINRHRWAGPTSSPQRIDPSGQHTAAVSHCRRDLKLVQRVYGAEDGRTLASMEGLAVALRQVGQHGEAADLLGQVLAVQ